MKKVNTIKPVAGPDSKPRAGKAGKGVFKSIHLITAHISAGGDNSVDPFADFIHERPVDPGEIKERIADCHSPD